MPNFSIPSVVITVAGEKPTPGQAVSRVTVLDQHLRTVAPGKSIELGGHVYVAGEMVPLTRAEGDELEVLGGILALHRVRRVDLREGRETDLQVGRVTPREGR